MNVYNTARIFERTNTVGRFYIINVNLLIASHVCLVIAVLSLSSLFLSPPLSLSLSLSPLSPSFSPSPSLCHSLSSSVSLSLSPSSSSPCPSLSLSLSLPSLSRFLPLCDLSLLPSSPLLRHPSSHSFTTTTKRRTDVDLLCNRMNKVVLLDSPWFVRSLHHTITHTSILFHDIQTVLMESVFTLPCSALRMYSYIEAMQTRVYLCTRGR